MRSDITSFERARQNVTHTRTETRDPETSPRIRANDEHGR